MIRTAAPLLLTAVVAAAPAALAAQAVEGRASTLELGGRLQVQYANSSVDEAVDDIFLRRARFEVDGTFTDALTGRLQLDFGGGETSVKDAYARYRVDPALRITAGQFKRPFSVFELASSTDLPIIERDGRVAGVAGCPGVGNVCSFSRLAQKLEFDDRDLGVMLDGSLGERVAWFASVTNGVGSPDENDGKSFTGRLELGATDDVVIGVFAGLHDYLATPDDTERAPAFGADVEVGTWRNGLHVLGAVMTGDNWDVSEEADFTALQGLVSYYVPLRGRFAGIEPLFRLSWASTDGVPPEVDGVDGLLLTPGVMLYIAGKNAVAANVDIYDAEPGDREWSLKIQSFLYF